MSTATVHSLHPDGPPPSQRQLFAWLLFLGRRAARACR